MKSGLLVVVGLLVLSGGLLAADSLRVTKVATYVGEIDYAYALAVEGDFAYIADHDQGMRVLHISNVEQLREVGLYATRTENHCIDVKKGRAYLGSLSSGFHVIDITNPSQPSRIGILRDPNPRGVAVSENYAYLATEWDGLLVIDITDERHPTQVGDHDMDSYCSGLDVSDGFAYVASDAGLYIIDVSDPAHPDSVGHYRSYNFAANVDVADNLAHVAYWETGVRVVNIDHPAEPIELDEYDIAGYINNVTVSGNHLYAAAGTDGFYVFDISNPRAIRRVGFYNTPGSASDIAVLPDGMIIVADSSNVGVYDCSEALSVPSVLPFILHPSSLILSSYPNPFNSSTTINYTLPRPGRYALDVVDIQGRLVTRLADGWREAGSYREVLNASDVPSGLLLVKLSSNLESRVQTLQLIK